MAFMPGHPFVEEAVDVMMSNLNRPRYLLNQNTLHSVLERAECRKEDNSYCEALHAPGKYCNEAKFRSFFPAGLRLFQGVNFNNALSHKVLHEGGEFYDYPEFRLKRK